MSDPINPITSNPTLANNTDMQIEDATPQTSSTPETRFPDGFDESSPITELTSRSYNRRLGESIAWDAEKEAKSRGTTGSCYNAVADVIDRQTDRFLWGMHAYQSADQFAARTDLFREIPPKDLDLLPPGAIVVWGKGTSISGHVSIALGDGREASDHIAPQMDQHYGGAPARVFIPIR